MAGEDSEGSKGGILAGAVPHRDDTGESRHTEIYSGASRRSDPDGLDFERMPTKGASVSS